jgi:hypothetical protein
MIKTLQIDALISTLLPYIAALLLLHIAFLSLKTRREVTRFPYGKRESYLRLVKKKSFSPTDKSNFASKNLLNNSEKQFFQVLTEALPDYYIFPQVSFNALITHASWISKTYWKRSVRMNFNTKYVDFVLCRKSDFGVVAIVEYDGKGHRNHNDEQRDKLLNSVGYRIERFVDGATIEFIRTRFDDLQAVNQV